MQACPTDCPWLFCPFIILFQGHPIIRPLLLLLPTTKRTAAAAFGASCPDSRLPLRLLPTPIQLPSEPSSFHPLLNLAPHETSEGQQDFGSESPSFSPLFTVAVSPLPAQRSTLAPAATSTELPLFPWPTLVSSLPLARPGHGSPIRLLLLLEHPFGRAGTVLY